MLQTEREVLMWRLHHDAPSLDRSDLTPPPMNSFAAQITDRVERLMCPVRNPFGNTEKTGKPAAKLVSSFKKRESKEFSEFVR
mmetsp:Transcript_45774/g.117598  ORF Transcript_45774/g.117598 Transcript_45774/m.117598 type:complete len:83 (+) Transcript_45774:255-503(+)